MTFFACMDLYGPPIITLFFSCPSPATHQRPDAHARFVARGAAVARVVSVPLGQCAARHSSPAKGARARPRSSAIEPNAENAQEARGGQAARKRRIQGMFGGRFFLFCPTSYRLVVNHCVARSLLCAGRPSPRGRRRLHRVARARGRQRRLSVQTVLQSRGCAVQSQAVEASGM